MGMKIRLTALMLAVTLLMNMVTLPVRAEEDTAPNEQIETVTGALEKVVESEQTSSEDSTPVESTNEESEPVESTSAESEPVESTAAESEPVESSAGEQSSDLLEQLETSEEEEMLLLEGSESPMFFALPRASTTISEQLTALSGENQGPLTENEKITIRSGEELYFLANNVNANIYQNCALEFVNSDNGFDVSEYDDFMGLGSDVFPFNGKITFGADSKTSFKLKQPLFQCLYDSAQVNASDKKLILQYAGVESDQKTALFAANVESNSRSQTWSFILQGEADSEEAKDVTCTPPLIGTIGGGCNVSLAVEDLTDLTVEAAGDAGLLCGRLNGSLTLTSLSKTEPINVKATDAAGGLVGEMGSGAELTVQVPELNVESVSAANGNAGGLVGKMCGGATLTVAPVTVTDSESGSPATSPAALSVNNVTATSTGNAGGLVGEMDNGAVLNVNASLSIGGTISATVDSAGGLAGKAQDVVFTNVPVPGSGTITGANAGGLIGSYTYSGVPGVLDSVSQSISDITVSGSSNAGGVFGVLNIGGNAEFTISSASISTNLTAGTTSCNGGGLIGKYTAGNLDAKLSLSAPDVSTTPSGTFSALGGLIGLVGDKDNGTANYIEIGTTEQSTITVTTSGASATDFGGLIAKLTNSGHMVKTVETVKVINSLPGSSTCGGLVGYMPSGVLWLGGSVDVTGVTTGGNILQNRGWILGSRDNTLVFTDQLNWNYAKGNNTNDIGNWGQVLSIPNICTNSTDDLLTVADHKVTVAAATSGDNTYSIGSPLEFAAIALRLQLDNQETGALNIPDDFSGDLNITLTNKIDLSGTGLTGFQRDYDTGVSALDVTIQGNNQTITLPDITVYIRDSSHKRQGLITKASFLDVSNLTISTPAGGSFKVEAQDGSNFYMGALAAEVTGNITLDNVTGSANLTSTNSGDESAVGGLIAVDTSDSATMKFTNCTWNGEITAGSNKSGLYMGGFLGRALKQKAHKVQVNGGTISGKLTREGSTTEARMGAMIGSLIGQSENPLKLEIDGLTVSANVTSNATQHAGALLSYEWYRTEAIVKKVNVTNSTLTASSRFGGLVYKGSGYWSIQPTTSGEEESATTTPGITISNSNFECRNSTGSSGLLVCHAEASDDFDALYLEILYGGYKIGGNVKITGVSTFDEIAGCTKGEKGNGIVSIATKDHELIDQSNTPNTYVNQLADSSFKNGNTRYYYNLDSFGAARANNVPSGEINSPAKMVMFSAYSHAQTNIKKYFYNGPTTITSPLADDGVTRQTIDLNGYSYYPAEQYTTVSGADIKFAFNEINNKEASNKPLGDSTQHYGMHTGIFRDVVNGSTENKTLEVTNLTLQGNVGYVGEKSGALICGDVHGNNTTAKKMTLTINDVTLNGIVVSPTPDGETVAPLLINSIGDYTTLDIKGVVTTGYGTGVTAASSLIGNVGSDNGAGITLAFSNMALDTIDGQKCNGKDSIFSRALFLESFRYSESDCSGVYNFGTADEHYTVGRELSNTGGGPVDGRNNGAQYWFHNSEVPVCGNDDQKGTFYKDYLRYVHCVEGKDKSGTADAKSHEIDVNVRTFGLTEGCGTYSHPYIITDGNQLKELAEVLNAGGKKAGWKVNLSAAVLNGTFSSQNGHTTSADTDCVTYTGGKGNWTNGTDSIDATDVLKYLRNAYYVIRGKKNEAGKNEITLSGTWAGLGGDSTDKSFSGVIVGEPDVTVKVVRPDSVKQFGGLIKFSQGSVVKNLKIQYIGAPTVTAIGAPTNISNASFFGGVVGWCIGGDTIIDNVTVAYNNNYPNTGSHLAAVGGYVGMVGGALNDAGTTNVENYGGGVVFRNMTDGSGLTDGKAYESSNYFYYNPYVGRVLDGYAMLEKPDEGTTYATSLDNTDKNYTIPTISAGIHLTREGEAVTVKDAEGLWLLSAIANSGAGAMGNDKCLAYYVGKPRTGTYDSVGGTLNASMAEYSDETRLGGDTSSPRTTCYLSKYVSGDFDGLCSSSGVSIVLESDCKMSGYGNGFRGIGSSYGTDADNSSNYRLIPVVSLSSAEEPKKTVTLQQSRKEYLEEMGNWTSIGSGLFVQLDGPSSGVQVSNLILSGSTSIQYYSGTELTGENPTGNHDEFSTRIAKVGSGMLAGGLFPYSDAGSITIENVELSNATVNSSETVTKNNVTRICTGSTNAGGLIGVIRNTRTKKNPNNQDVPCLESVTLKNCGYTGLNVTGRLNVGGFIGYVRAVKTVKVNNADTNIAVAVNILYSANKTLTNGVITSTRFKAEKEYGCGGLIGFSSDANLSIMPDSTSSDARLTLKNLTVHGNAGDGSGDRANVGGVVGYWKAQRVPVEAKNISLEGDVSIAGSENGSSKAAVGGFAGTLADDLSTWHGSTVKGATIENFWIAQESGSDAKIYNGRPIGGLIGTMKAGGTINVSGIKVGSDHGQNTSPGTVTVANNVTIGDDSHSAGGLLGSNHNVSTTITFEDIQMVHTTVIAYNSSSNFRGAGIVFSYFENTLTVNLKNVLLDQCKVVGNRPDMRMGLLYGQLNASYSNHLNGSNILIKDCVVGYSNNTNDCKTDGKTCPTVPTAIQYTEGPKMGILGGESNGRNVKLVGVSIRQSANTLPERDFGTNPGTYYVVRADYMGYQDVDAEAIQDTKAPYVTTSPLSPLTLDGSRKTGDGASFVKNTTTPVGKQILDDLTPKKNAEGDDIPLTNLNLKHSAALAYGENANSPNAKKAYEYLRENSGKAFFGDFKQQGGNSEENYKGANFPVLTLVTNSSTETNALIYSWISLLTNRTIDNTIVSDSSNGVSIAVTRWKWENTSWVEDTDETGLPLQFNSNEFTLTKGVYDSGQKRFTLLDVAFADPAGGSEPAYHLYIPVIVQKMLRFRFWASAQTGTTYIKNSYMQQDALAAASHGQQVTVLMSFEYNRTQKQWQEAVNNGDKLLFGFNKTIQLDGDSLPTGTRLTLVDCANQNKAYFAVGSAIKQVNSTIHKLSFTEFDSWSPKYLCDMLVLSPAMNNSGQYYKLPAYTPEATVRIPNPDPNPEAGDGYDYYQYVAAEDTVPVDSEGPYSITVGWSPRDDEPLLREQYYLTIQTPEEPPEEFKICNNRIICPSSLESAELPTLRENNPDAAEPSDGKYTRRGYENRVLIGDFFTQTVTINTEPSYPEMSTVNHTIHATLTSKIKFNTPENAELFKKFASGQKLFQSFELRMQEIKDGETQPPRINLVPGTRITAKYFLGGVPKATTTYTISSSTPSFRLDFPEGVDVQNWNAQEETEFKVELTLEYSDAAILAQFPYITGSSVNTGVSLGTGSYLAYTEEALPTTTIHTDKWGEQNFYRRDYKAASLNYYPVGTVEGSAVESVNQLGVNGWNQQNAPISSAATYDASALDDAGNAKTLRCKLSLKRKTDNGYEPVEDWGKYLAEGSAPTVTVNYNTSDASAKVDSTTLAGNVYTTQFGLTDYEKDVPIEIRVDMNVLTGSGFEAEDKVLTYANYKVEMLAELLDSNGNVIIGSRAEDFIVYTNARINPKPIR